MSGYFLWPLGLAAVWAMIWAAAAKGYNTGTYPRKVAAHSFGGPVREYVFPGGFFAALACLLSTLLSDAVRAVPDLMWLLRAAAMLFCIASLLGLFLYQTLENMRSQDGTSIELESPAPIMFLGVIYALLTAAVTTITFAVWTSSAIPTKVEAPKDQASVSPSDAAPEASPSASEMGG